MNQSFGPPVQFLLQFCHNFCVCTEAENSLVVNSLILVVFIVFIYYFESSIFVFFFKWKNKMWLVHGCNFIYFSMTVEEIFWGMDYFLKNVIMLWGTCPNEFTSLPLPCIPKPWLHRCFVVILFSSINKKYIRYWIIIFLTLLNCWICEKYITFYNYIYIYICQDSLMIRKFKRTFEIEVVTI